MELLLASGLTTIVLAALLTAITFVARTEGTSSDRVELVRLGKALLDQFERDLGSLVVVAEVSDESDRQVEADDAPEAEAIDALVSLAGNSEELSLVIDTVLPTTEQVSQLAAWEFDSGELDGGMGPIRRTIYWALQADENGQPIAREALITSSDGALVTTVGTIAIPEMASLSFAYLSDGEWVDEWADSEAAPVAVRVMFELTTLDPDGEPSGSEVPFDRIFSVPLARYPAAAAAVDETGLSEGDL